MTIFLFVAFVVLAGALVYSIYLGVRQARRLDSALQAVDDQRERIGILKEEIGEIEAARDALAEELTVAHHEVAGLTLERDAMKWRVEQQEKRALESAVPLVAFTKHHETLLRDRGESQKDLLEAVAALIADEALAAAGASIAPGVGERDQCHLAGGAHALHGLRRRLDRTTRPRNDAK